MLPPSFLRPSSSHSSASDKQFNVLDSVAVHQSHLTHALWFPPSTPDQSIRTVLLFVPGNPGFIRFYIPFLAAIRDQIPNLAVLAHAHVGHSAVAPIPDHLIGLDAQVENAVEAYDLVRAEFASDCRVMLVAHSVGAWISLQVAKVRPDIDALFLICPTISNIASTPNGRRLSWLFRSPIPRLVSWLACALPFVPTSLILSTLYSHWPAEQILVLRAFLGSPQSVFACMTMAHQEMERIFALDSDVVLQHADKIHCLYGFSDDWVGMEEKALTSLLRERKTPDLHILRINVPHAFCIEHGSEVASHVISWLRVLDGSS